MRCLAAIHGESTTVLFSTQCGTGRAQKNETFDQNVIEGTCCTWLGVAGCDVDLLVLDAGSFFPLPTLRVMLPLLLYIKSESLLKAGFGFAVCCAV